MQWLKRLIKNTKTAEVDKKFHMLLTYFEKTEFKAKPSSIIEKKT